MKRIRATMKRTIQQEKTNLVINMGELVFLEVTSEKVYKARPANRRWIDSLFVFVTKGDVISQQESGG